MEQPEENIISDDKYSLNRSKTPRIDLNKEYERERLVEMEQQKYVEKVINTFRNQQDTNSLIPVDGKDKTESTPEDAAEVSNEQESLNNLQKKFDEEIEGQH